MAVKENILVVDDDINALQMVDNFLKIKKKYDVTPCLTFRDAMKEMSEGRFSAAVLDYFMPDTSGLELMKAVKGVDPDLPVIILTASRDIKLAIETIREGAFNYLTKPVDPDDLYLNLDNALTNRKLVMENRRLRLDLRERFKFDSIIGSSGRMREVFDMTERAARVRSTVLITGETGSGKELVAKAVHYNSGRAEKPFIKVNCSAIPESLLEAELFGIESNVATGVDARIGKFEAADGGTLFLDEIGDMALSTQAKVLRAMQEREVERVGSHQPRKVDIRIIAATNRNLSKAIEEGQFRNDLFYRLNVLVISLPPLRERKDDIPALAEHFAEKFCAENGLKIKRIDPAAMGRLTGYSWPGNVRELENAIERAVVVCDGDTLGVEHIPPSVRQGDEILFTMPPEETGGLDEMVSEFEKSLILTALERNGWRQNRAAKDLNITERSMWYKIKKYGIDTRRFKES
ncbi:MAG: sigma-54-dependent transcriptional regulator [Candidatus Nitrospinota bacterium M3_3B_026]